MQKSRYTEEKIIKILKESEAGKKIVDICREYGISDATFYKYLKQTFSHMILQQPL